MRRIRLLVLALLLLAVAAAAACAPAAPAGPTAVGAFPTPLVSQGVGRVAQPTAFPSLTPLAPAANAAAYGSVQLNAAGAIVPTTNPGANAPLLFSAQAVETVVGAQITPGATVVVIVQATPIIVVPGGSNIAVPPIGDNTGGFIVNLINSVCIPVINFILSATVGLVVAVWNFVGTLTNTLGQVGLCVVVPALLLWFYLFRRRRRRR